MLSTSTHQSILPVPEAAVRIRPATVDDIAFMDSLQKGTTKQVGYFPTGQFKGYIEQGAVLIAHEPGRPDERLGYVISKDRYLKRDELGVIYQLNVAPGMQRKLVGATLIRSVFERSAYGCRLYCCWCAQDIAANHFWESLGFVPVAFRAGSSGKKRVHIFWQRRIDSNDTATRWWYPFQTNGGAMNQDRLVFPIPPGVDWRDVTAMAMVTEDVAGTGTLSDAQPMQLPAGPIGRKPKAKAAKVADGPPAGKVGIFIGGKIRYVDRPGYVPPTFEPVKKPRTAKPTKPPAPKFDPKHLVAARELRDRYLENVNDGCWVLSSGGKYEVGRAIGADGISNTSDSAEGLAAPRKRLPAA